MSLQERRDLGFGMCVTASLGQQQRGWGRHRKKSMGFAGADFSRENITSKHELHKSHGHENRF